MLKIERNLAKSNKSHYIEILDIGSNVVILQLERYIFTVFIGHVMPELIKCNDSNVTCKYLEKLREEHIQKSVLALFKSFPKINDYLT